MEINNTMDINDDEYVEIDEDDNSINISIESEASISYEEGDESKESMVIEEEEEECVSESIRMDDEDHDDVEDNAMFSSNELIGISANSTGVGSERRCTNDEAIGQKGHNDDNDDDVDIYEKNVPRLISSLEALQKTIDDVIAFPSVANFKRMHHQGSSAHSLYIELSRLIEFGELKHKTKHNKDSTTKAIDEETRAKLTSYGTNIWLNVQNNPDAFRDFLPSSSSSRYDIAQDEKNHDTVQAQELEKERAAASGYVRSLACRLVLISKIQTKDLSIPKLMKKEKKDKGQSSKLLATNGELEFAFKCLSRAGRAIMHHSSSLGSMSSIPDVFDPSAAYLTLSLALVFWEGLEKLQSINKDNSKIGLFTDDAFDAMLSLPDCATLLGSNARNSNSDNNDNGDTESKPNIDVTNLALEQLKRLEDIVNNQVSSIGNKNNELKSIQYFLPSLARMSYKHGNRLARLSDFTSSQEAIRIALCATDKCLAMIREKIQCDRDTENRVSNSIQRSFQIQEQEMLVLSKQSFYVLSHVCRSIGKIVEANKCLDRIEVYIDEQMQKDDKQFKETMKHIAESNSRSTESYAGLSGFALEGPKKQDIAEIKARATSARKKSKYGEMMERINLAYSRIMMNCNTVTSVEEEEKLKDSQFKIMVEISKQIESNNHESNVELRSLVNSSYDSPSKHRDTFDMMLSAARSIFVQREKNSSSTRYYDPYDVLFLEYPKNHDRNMLIRLEFLNTVLVVAKNTKKLTAEGSRFASTIDQRALDTGKELVSQLVKAMTSKTTMGRSEPIGSTLFSNNKDIPKADLTRVLEDSREHFTRAVSFYYSSGNGYSKAVEWCDLLTEILLASQQYSFTMQKEEVEKESCDHVLSEIMSTKALSLSMTNCHGAALKVAREACEKYEAEMGNVITLFHCSVQYETFSGLDSSNEGTFEKTLFELDNSISSFLTLSKLSTSSMSNHDKLLEAFPVMCNTASQIENNQTGPLLLGLQRRYIDSLVNSIFLKVSQGNWNLSDEDERIGNLPGGNNIFDVLCAYLGNIDAILSSSDYKFNHKWYSEQYQSIQKTLDSVLNLLVVVRDQGIKHEDSLLSFSEPFKDKETRTILLFENKNVCRVIGNGADCLWTAEQLWNIATQIMTKEFTTVKGQSNGRLHTAEFFSKAHDFALLSEEECGAALTKGHLAFENFHSKELKAKLIDFSLNVKVETMDICSEFSAQCLLLRVAHVLDDMNDQLSSNDNNRNCLSTEQEQLLAKTMNCLIATMTEMKVLGTEVNGDLVQQVTWLALSLLIALRDDEFCSITLTKRGLLSRLEAELLNWTKEDNDIEDEGIVHPLHKILLLSTRAEYFGMNESTKLLLTLCARDVIQRGHSKFGKIPSLDSIGLMQRKIINLASKVEEVVNVFTVVDEQVKKAIKASSSDENLTSTNYPYTTEDMDYFVIEAHNRAVSLLYIGDFVNAEKLLTVALNLLPRSGKEVESHGAEIRKVYRGVIQKRGNALSMSSDHMISLFEG